MKIGSVLSISLSFFIVGCASFSKKVSVANTVSISERTIKSIEGIYIAVPLLASSSSEFRKPTAIDILKLKQFNLFDNFRETEQNREKPADKNFSAYNVKIQILNNKEILFTLLQNNIPIDSAINKFSLKNKGFINLKNKNLTTMGVPGVYGNFELSRTRISSDNMGNLIVDNAYFMYGAALIIIGDTRKNHMSAIYQKQHIPK